MSALVLVNQDVLISIRESRPLSEIGFKIGPNAERYLKTPKEMEHLYKDFPELLSRTIDIAESCTFSPSELKYRYPSKWIPGEFNAQSYLEHLVWKSAPDPYQSGINDRVRTQLLQELRLKRDLCRIG